MCLTFEACCNRTIFNGVYKRLSYTIDDKSRLVKKIASFFIVYFFPPLSFLFVGLDRGDNTKGIEMQMNN